MPDAAPRGTPAELTLQSFLKQLVLVTASEAQDMLSPQKARELVSLVGLEMAENLMDSASAVLEDPEAPWDEAALAKVLVALKQSIEGAFEVESVEPGKVTLTSRRCPFGEGVEGRPALCMMTSSVFGGIAARHFGRARVDVDESIARGHAGCRVTIHLGKGTHAVAPHAWSATYHGGD